MCTAEVVGGCVRNDGRLGDLRRVLSDQLAVHAISNQSSLNRYSSSRLAKAMDGQRIGLNDHTITEDYCHIEWKHLKLVSRFFPGTSGQRRPPSSEI